jgi:trimeric autotransporter adhesin
VRRRRVLWLELLEPRLAPATTFSIANSSVIEPAPNGMVNLDFTVTRSGDLTSQVTLGYTTVAGTAQPNTDFTPTTGTTTFASGSATATIGIPVFGNGVFNNPSLIFSVQLTGIVNVVGPPVTLAAASDFTTGPLPISIAVGDFNGDGKPDIVTADFSPSNSVSVLLNTTAPGATTPSFAAGVDFAVGVGPASVAVADFNGDGKPDIVVANQNANSVSILLNTTAPGATTPSFATHVDFATGSLPEGVAVGDVNGDGQPDLVVASAGSHAISVLLNTTAPGAGIPSFATHVDFAAEPDTDSVTLGDLNGDGKLDIVVGQAGSYSQSVAVLLNTTTPGAATPSFTPQVDFATGATPGSVAIGDLNGDGLLDIVTSNATSNDASVLINTTAPGASTPSFAAHADFAAVTNPSAVVIGDLNGDGKPDLIVVSNVSGGAVLVDTAAPGAAPSFAAPIAFDAATNPASVALGDFNGDGELDLAVANLNSNNASVLLNTTVLGAATIVPDFPQAATPTVGVGSVPVSVAVGDINGDGKPDLVVANFLYNGRVSVLLNTTTPGAATPSFAPEMDFATGRYPRSVAVADLNGDGRPDLVVATGGSNTVSVLLNMTTPGATTPSFATSVDFATGANPFSLMVADLNGDGKPDLVVANRESDNVSVLLNTTTPGATTPSFATQVTFAVGNDPESVAVSDLNGDGKPDLVVANYNYHGSGSISVLLNTTTPGAATPSFAAQVSFAVGNNPESVAIGDFNGDGRPDLVVANHGSNTVSVLLNTTPPGAVVPAFAAQVDFATGVRPIAVAVADLNGDGKPDLAFVNVYEGTGGNSVSVLLNTTAPGAVLPAFTPKVDFATGTSPGFVAIGDLNGDGRPDLAVANEANNDLSVLLNTPATITQATAVGTITENDPPPTVQFASATQSVNETDGTFTVTVNLSAVSGVDTTIPFTLGGTAVSGADYSNVTLSPLVIAAGQTSGTISGTLLADPGSNQTLTVTLGTPTNATLGSPATATLTIVEPSLPPPPSQLSLPPFVSVAFGPAGEVVELVNSAGVLTQFDATGVHQLGNGGVRSASIAFGPSGQVLEIVSTAGILTQFDSTGAHQLGGVGVESASIAFGPDGGVLEVVLIDGSVRQFSAAGVQVLGTGGVVSASAAFGPGGLVLEILSTAGVLTEFSAAGAQQLGGAGVQSAGVAFTSYGEVLDIIFSDGTLDRFDAFGQHRLGMVP